MKLKKIISNLSLKEKVSLLSGFDNWYTPELKKYGIPKIKMSDGPNGVRGDSNTPQTSACFPSPILLGATWNEKLIKKIGSATGEEALFKDVKDVDDDDNIWNEVRYLLRGAAQYKINLDLYGYDKKEEE